MLEPQTGPPLPAQGRPVLQMAIKLAAAGPVPHARAARAVTRPTESARAAGRACARKASPSRGPRRACCASCASCAGGARASRAAVLISATA